MKWKAFHGRFSALGPLAYRALGYAYLQATEKDIPSGIESLKKYIELAPDAQDADRIKMIVEGIK